MSSPECLVLLPDDTRMHLFWHSHLSALGLADSDLQSVKRDVEAAERKLAELRAEKERVSRQVDLTFNDAWAGLMNKCLETRMPQFTYK